MNKLLLGGVTACAFALSPTLHSQARAQDYRVTAETIAATTATTDYDLADETNGATSASAASYILDTTGMLVDERASANLATGELKAFHRGEATIFWDPPIQLDGQGWSRAIIRDTLYFSVAGAEIDTITPVQFSFQSSGNIANDLTAETPNSITVTFGGSVGSSFFSYQYQNGQVQTGDGNWSSFNFTTVTPPDGFIGGAPLSVTGIGVLDVMGPQVALPIYLELFVGGSAYSVADFSHTAFVDLVLPSGVTLGSASGVFLSQARGDTLGAIPEPATWALLICGFAAVGASLRHRRTGLARAAA